MGSSALVATKMMSALLIFACKFSSSSYESEYFLANSAAFSEVRFHHGNRSAWQVINKVYACIATYFASTDQQDIFSGYMLKMLFGILYCSKRYRKQYPPLMLVVVRIFFEACKTSFTIRSRYAPRQLFVLKICS
jgi:hypothetical protein